MDKKMTLSEYEEIARHRIQHLIDKYCYGSQQVFADRTGINKASVSQYVNGKNTPSSVTAEKIAKAFGCAPEWVMGFSSRDDSNDLADDERILVANYRKLSPIEKESINNIIDKMANGSTAADLDRVIESKQDEPEVITLNPPDKVMVISVDGKKTSFVGIDAAKVVATAAAPAPSKFRVKYRPHTPAGVGRPNLKKILSNKAAKRKKEG